MSKVYSLKAVQEIPVSLEEAWDFFSSPKNLPKITPGNMGFNIISKHHGEKMYPGQLIEYKVSPVLNIPMYWMTEITHVEDKNILWMNSASGLIACGTTSIILKQRRWG
jgi:ligand-binding SRPBCC domain-containing protein